MTADAEDLLGLTARLVDLPSESGNEGPITAYIASYLAERAPWLAVDSVGWNIVARTRLGRTSRLVLAGHTDTVPVNGNLPSRREGDVLWGCGSADMKSGLAVMLALAAAVPEPAVDVTWVFYEAEEIESRYNGLGRLFEETPELVAGDVALLGEPTDGVVEAGCQGTMRLRVTLRGERAHTARPWMGRNAIHRLGGLLRTLECYQERRPVLDGCTYREALQAVRVEGGIAGNVVPDAATVLVNHRFAPDRTPAEAEAHVRALLSPSLEPGDEVEIVDCADGAAPALTHPLLTALIERNELDVRAKLGWTDVARFASRGIPAANFGPGDATLAHTADERVGRGPIERTYRALEDLVRVGAVAGTRRTRAGLRGDGAR